MQSMRITFGATLVAILTLFLGGCDTDTPDIPEGTEVDAQIISVALDTPNNKVTVGYEYIWQGKTYQDSVDIYVPATDEYSREVLEVYEQEENNSNPTAAEVARWLGGKIGIWVKIRI